MLGRRHVLPSVTASLTELMVEGTFPSGTYLVTVHHPISTDDGDLEKALFGSFLPIPPEEVFPLPDPNQYQYLDLPGAVKAVKEGHIRMKEGRKRIKLKVVSKGDRPIQVLTRSNAPLALLCADQKNRSVPITILLKQILSWISTASKHMGLSWILQLALQYVSSPETRRQ